MTYSIDFRIKVLKIKAKERLSYAATSKRFDISINSILRWSKEVKPKAAPPRIPRKIVYDVLKQDIECNPDAYQYERAQRLGVSQAGIYKALKRLGITYKKNAESSQEMRRRSGYLPAEDRSLQ